MTKYLLFSGELIDAATALRAGLVDRLIPAEDLEAEVHRFAEVLATRSALTQRATKEVVAALTAGGTRRGGRRRRWYRETIAPASWPRGWPPSPSGVRRASAGQVEQVSSVSDRAPPGVAEGCGAPSGGRTGAARPRADRPPARPRRKDAPGGQPRLPVQQAPEAPVPPRSPPDGVGHVWRNGPGVAPHPTTNHAEEDR